MIGKLKVKKKMLLSALTLLAAAGCQRAEVSGQQPLTSQPTASKDATAEPTPAAPIKPEAPAKTPPANLQPGTTKPGAPVTPPNAKDVKKRLEDLAAKVDAYEKIQLTRPIDKDWKATTMTPHTLASLVSSSIKGLQNTKAAIDTYVQTPQGRGEFHQALEVKDASTFRVPFVVPLQDPTDGNVVANGSKKIVGEGKTWYPATTVSSPTRLSKESHDQMAEGWKTEFTRLMFQGLTDGRDAWGPVVQDWEEGVGGYQMAIEEKHTPFEGHEIIDYELHLSRAPQFASKLGKSEIIVEVDGYHYLPVSAWSDFTAPDGKHWKFSWSARYLFKQPTSPKDFIAPYAMKAKA